MSSEWKVVELVNTTKLFFEKQGIRGSARLDAELLLAKVLGCKRIDLYLRFDQVVPEPKLSEFRELVRERGKRRPVKQILGRCEFLSNEFEVTPDVLVPRPETEGVVEAALRLMGTASQVIADIGTGCGNIAISIALARPDSVVYATDISAAALEVARRNAAAHGVAGRVMLLEGDWLEPLAGRGLEHGVDCIVSNPPYIAESSRETLMPEVALYEPPIALFSGDDGMEHTLRLLKDAPRFLRPGAVLIVETCPLIAAQARAAAEASGSYEDVRTERDLAQKERVLTARMRSTS